MRILLVNAHGSDTAYGGAERRVRYLATGLTGRGHHVEVLSAFPQKSEPAAETRVLHRTDWREDQLRRLRNHVGDVVSAPWPSLTAALDAARPDLVHTHNLPGIGTGIWEAARRKGIPAVHSILDYYLLCPRTSLLRRDGDPCKPHPLLCGARTHRLVRWNRGVDAILGTSEHVLRVHEGLFPTAIRTTMPPPMMPLAGPKPEPAGIPASSLGYMGSLTTAKGVQLLLDAAPLLARQGLTLRIAGGGPLRSAVEEAPNVRYEGRLEGEQLARFVGSCDAGVVPSLWDEPGGGPFVLGEWLGAGRPVLTTRRGGLAESADIGGVATFGETPVALASATEGLGSGSGWADLVAAVPIIDAQASLEQWLDRHLAVYGEAVDRRIARTAA